MSNTILLLASDAPIRKAICKALESAGYFVLTASNLGAAMDLLKDCKPDLLMLRHYTQSISGHDAAAYMRRTRPGIPILIVGGILDDPALDVRESIAGFEIFPRPFKAVELLDKVKQVLTKYPSRRKLSL